ncbi:Anaphase-promoting complex subunit 2 [Coemansia sp. RSA 1939]|nr:Anaphase-promoting complex subunit 2 [Coemansia sp. RSA 1939]KAJ2618227.1 Anaphase-promoting complex subunit 2 [Coemansia sp. RSA 1804]
MDTAASDRCARLPEREIHALVSKIKAHAASTESNTVVYRHQWRDRDAGSGIDAVATEYWGRLRQLRTETVPADISRPSASILFHEFLGAVAQLHSEFRHRATATTVDSDDDEGSRARREALATRAWDALMCGELLGLNNNNNNSYTSGSESSSRVAEWVEEWAHTAVSALVHLGRCVPPLRLCSETGLAPHTVASLERYYEAAGGAHDVLGIGVEEAHKLSRSDDTSTSFDDLDDEDPAASVDERRRRKYFRHLSRDSQTACVFVNGCAESCRMLVDLGLAARVRDRLVGAVSRIARDAVDAHADQWGDPSLARIAHSVCMATATFEALLRFASTKEEEEQGEGLLADHARLAVLRRMADLRTRELFGIIIDYPESRAAIDDLRACVGELKSMRTVALELRDAIQRRLLHPGATTGDILTQYVSAIRCLRLLDPSSTVLEIVARPIRAYLRSRADTVACIVQDMVSEDGSELFEDPAGAGGRRVLALLNMENEPDGIVYDEEYATDGGGWEPLPIEAKTVYRTAQRRDADVLSLLVSIYDTRDVFVREFETHLERQLLRSADAGTWATVDREIKQVEMMKLRFGDLALARCEVMLKDIADSRRIAQSVADSYPVPLATAVVSRQFWSPPDPPNEPFVLPEPMAGLADQYARTYQTLKPARTLEWRNAMGHVTLAIELADRSLELAVKPAQAAVLFAFQQHGTRTVAEAAESLGASAAFVLPRIRFWQARGVLRETASGSFAVVEAENSSSGSSSRNAIVGDNNEGRSEREGASAGEEEEEEEEEEDDDDDASQTASGAASTEALRVNFKYIVGMLTNLGPLPLDRIRSMLSMFVPGETTTPEELRAFLAQMVREGRLELADGTYRLRP